MAELRGWCRESCQADWAEGHALSYGENAGYLVARDVLRHALGLDYEASPAEVARVLQTEVAQLFAGQAAEIYPFLAHLLEAPLDDESAQRLKYLEGEMLHQRLLQAAQNFLTARARRTALVLVWDDLHWGDPSSLGLLEALLPLTQQCPLLLVMVYRPVREARVWQFHQRVGQRLGEAHCVLELSPLSMAESSQLLDNLLEQSELPPKIRRLILTKAEGNPFYIEEVIRSLLDSGALARSDSGLSWQAPATIGDVSLPDTLQGMIMARIDRLEPDTKRTLQVAAVIGHAFPYRVLARVMRTE
jgi:predicted ATPase